MLISNYFTDEKKESSTNPNVKDIISKIDWNVNSNSYYRSRSTRTIENYHRVNQISSSNTEHNNVIIDDEDLHMLRNAFSFSDQSQRGYRLGPESNGPYPIFQTVDLSITDIFKGTGWRSLAGLLDTVHDNENQEQDVILCGMGNNSNCFRNSGEIQRDRADEIEQVRSTSACLMRHLQELLDSSKETLSSIENSNINRKKSIINNREI